MSMTGGISFYDQSQSLFETSSTAIASSNTTDQNLPLGTNNVFKWQSIGSNDVTTETYTVTLPVAIPISRLFLINHNFKNFQVKYGASLDFTNVLGLDSYSANNIAVTNFSRDTAYFEFDYVTTNTIILTIDTTQIASAEKFITQFIVTNELGTLTGFPTLNNVNLDRNTKREEAISGRFHIQKGYESAAFKLSLKRYAKQSDIDLLDSLHNRETPFLTWLSGGLPDQFTINQRGFRIRDLYNMHIDKALKNGYDKNVYLIGVNQSYSFIEVV